VGRLDDGLNVSERGHHLRSRAVAALLVATGAAGGANDNHATAFAAVLVGGHSGDWIWWCFVFVFMFSVSEALVGLFKSEARIGESNV